MKVHFPEAVVLYDGFFENYNEIHPDDPSHYPISFHL